MAITLEQAGDGAGALAAWRKLARTHAGLFATDPTDAENTREVVSVQLAIGSLLERMGHMAGAVESYRQGMAWAEKVEQAGPQTAVFRNSLASEYLALGDRYARLASHRRATAGRRIELWRQARSCFQHSLAIWRDRRSQPGTSAPLPGSGPERAAEEMAKCDAAIASLSARARP